MIKVIENELLIEFKDRNAWDNRRAFAFHKCIETGCIIWPAQTAYFGSIFVQHRYGVPSLYINWLSRKGYLIWRLKGWL